MANEKTPAAPPAPKMICARVVRNYGRHLAGQWCEVEEREYLRLRKPDGEGGYRFPILISQADADALDAKKRAAAQQAEAARAAADVDRATSEGWADYQRRASEILAAQRIQDQQAQNAVLLGQAAQMDPAATAKRFAENVAAGRGA